MAVELWLLFALLAVAGKTAYYALQKVHLDTESSLRLSYISAFYGTVLLVPIAGYLWYTRGLSLTAIEAAIIASLGVIELVGLLVYLESLALTDMSVASPLKKTKPIGVALLEPFVLGTTLVVPLVGAAVLAGVGGYVVLMKGRDLFVPFRRLTERGPALALLAAGIYIVLSLGSRFGNTATSPAVFGAIVFSVMWLGYAVGLYHRGELPAPRAHFRRHYVVIGGTGVFRSAMVWTAYSLASATLVSTVSQLTILTDVLVAGTLLSEGNTRRRVVGAMLILGGVVVVTLLG